MAFHVRDQETDDLVRKLALSRGVGLTEAVKLAVKAELGRQQRQTPLAERIRVLQDELAMRARTGLKADKAFFDELSGDEG
jgi:antitoxin VapB